MREGTARDALQLRDLFRDCEELDPEAFGRKHGSGCLVHQGSVGGLRAPERLQQTVSTESPLPGPAPGFVARGDYLVFPLRRTGRCPYPRIISVGRTENNDVVIRDASLSKFHAYFTEAENGDLLLRDAGSRNGTFLEDEPVPSTKSGKPVEVRPGARVRFGFVALTFLGVTELRAMIKRFGRTLPAPP